MFPRDMFIPGLSLKEITQNSQVQCMQLLLYLCDLMMEILHICQIDVFYLIKLMDAILIKNLPPYRKTLLRHILELELYQFSLETYSIYLFITPQIRDLGRSILFLPLAPTYVQSIRTFLVKKYLVQSDGIIIEHCLRGR